MAEPQRTYVTQEFLEKMKNELAQLKTKKRAEVAQRLKEAIAMGDLSENFEYKSAMEDKDFINSRIVEIQNLINDVEIIDKDKDSSKSDKVVDFGSTVTFKIEDDDKEYQVRIVGTGEVGIDDGVMISFDSPIGQAIRGRKSGETVKMRHESGRKSIKILAIS